MQFLIRNYPSRYVATVRRFARLPSFSAIILISLAGISTHTHAEPVTSLSLEAFVETDSPYWEVSVKCESIDAPKLMRKPIQASLWCAVDDSTLCDEDKYALSRQMCGDTTASESAQEEPSQESPSSSPAAAEAPEAREIITDDTTEASAVPEPVTNTETNAADQSSTTTLASRSQLMREKMQVEEQRILIEQRRIELQARELELKKQQIGN